MFALLPILAASCTLSPNDSTTMSHFLDAWSFVSEQRLMLARVQPPLIIVADSTCQYSFRPGPGPFNLYGVRLAQHGIEHHGTLRLPTGATMPLAGMAFTSLYGPSSDPFFVMALPYVWRHDPKFRGDTTNWDLFLPPVGIHELTHTRQLAAIMSVLVPDAKKLGVTSLDDDLLQVRWRGRPGFARAVLHERDLFFAAARAPAHQRDSLVRAALRARAARHRRWFTANAAAWADVETRFIDMEGVGQWAALQYRLMTERDTAGAIARVRDNQKWWSQEYGLAVYLTLDRMVPRWQREVFPPRLATAFSLIEAQLGRERR